MVILKVKFTQIDSCLSENDVAEKTQNIARQDRKVQSRIGKFEGDIKGGLKLYIISDSRKWRKLC